MTVTAMAKQLNVSTMTIYRRCKRNGVNLDELRDGETNELTSAGVAVIASLFDATAPQTTATDDTTQLQQGRNSDAQPMPQDTGPASTAVRVAELAATVEGQRVLIETLTSERDELRRQLAAVTAALAAEQADRQAERRLLTGGGGNDVQPRRHWWQWGRR